MTWRWLCRVLARIGRYEAEGVPCKCGCIVRYPVAVDATCPLCGSDLDVAARRAPGGK